MNRPKLMMLPLVAACALGLAPLAVADTLNLTLVNGNQTVLSGGATVPFFAVLMNPSPTDTIFLNSDSFSTLSSWLSVNDTPFFNNAPLSLAPLASTGPFELFDVNVNAHTPPGFYGGNSFTILGGADGGANTAFDPLASVSFAVQVVPEPGSIGLLGSGLAGLLFLRFRRRRA